MARVLTSIVIAPAIWACAGNSSREQTGGGEVSSKTIEQVLASHNDSLMALPGVVGTAIGLCDGAACIRVFVSDSSAARARRIPDTLDGFPVRVEVSGPFRPRGSGAE